ncbi:MAG: hypothetical protein Q4D05_05845 [Acinetobacter sp.]|nr:hypothetical protein [Acinetobacter sp.]
MQPTISRVLFYSLIFAIGVAPTAAMWVLKYNRVGIEQIESAMSAFIGLTLLFALIFIPIILVQNAYLFIKRKNPELDAKVVGLSRFYVIANGLCLLSWIVFLLWDKL